MTARFFWDEEDTRGHRPRLQPGRGDWNGGTDSDFERNSESVPPNLDRIFQAAMRFNRYR